MDRKLASIQKIISLSPIEGADSIEKAIILGWELVVKKDEFAVGDLCVYCEVDSIMPEKPEFEFLRERKFRIRTIKLRGQVSQGIAFPMSILPGGRYSEGDDVTKIMGVIKHDPQAEYERKEAERLSSVHKNRMGKMLARYAWYRRLFFRPKKTSFPPFIKKTDEDRIQLFPNACTEWAGVRFTATEKIDGQSGTYFLIPNPRRRLFGDKWLFGVCSRNFQLIVPDDSSYWDIARKYNLKSEMTEYCERNGAGLIVQGEIIGPKIQGNKYGLSENDFYVFNVISYQAGRAVVFEPLSQFVACAILGLKPVPPITASFLLPNTIHEAVDMAKGKSTLRDIPREGLVVRNYDRGTSFKIINPDFLLKYTE